MMLPTVLIIVGTLLVHLTLTECNGRIVSVTYDAQLGSFTSHEGKVKNWVARANFSDNTVNDGWAYLEVETRPLVPDTIQSYAAGYAEGAASVDIIYNFYRNTVEGYCESKGQQFCDNLRAFVTKNVEWMKAMYHLKGDSCPVWHNVELVLNQLQGLSDGYTAVSDKPLDYDVFMLMNLSGDLEDLESVLDDSSRSASLKEVAGRVLGSGSCSALIKLLPGNSDLYTAHDTWDNYQAMLRIQKKYIFPFRRTGSSSEVIPGHTVTLSSSPGTIHSGDDFYVLSSGLVTVETTIGNSNPALWANVTAEGEIPEWIRALVANRIATDGASWAKFFSMHNSGTYNNQWMIVDYKKFKPNRPVKSGLLWVVEQIPGLIRSADQSLVLRRHKYWASYNVPFYQDIYNISGWPALVTEFGDWFTYDRTARALIFKRDQNEVTDISSMIRLMRYNDFQHDPLSHCECSPPYSAENAISARNDRNPKNGTYPFGALGHHSHGGTDMKMTSASMAQQLRFMAVNGPTYDDQPPFRWSEQDFQANTPHYGQPDLMKFPVVRHKWIW